MAMYAEVEKIHNDFYKKLHRDNDEAFQKLYSSCGSSAELPEYPKHLDEWVADESGSWTFRDPSKWAFQSWTVAKWKGFEMLKSNVFTKPCFQTTQTNLFGFLYV